METSGKRRLRMGKKGQSTRSGKTLVENRSVRTRSCLDTEAIKTLQIAYEFHGYWEETLVCQGEKYCKIEIEGGGHLQTVGAPKTVSYTHLLLVKKLKERCWGFWY